MSRPAISLLTPSCAHGNTGGPAVATDDALIAIFDAKYHYNFWRPVTAMGKQVGALAVAKYLLRPD